MFREMLDTIPSLLTFVPSQFRPMVSMLVTKKLASLPKTQIDAFGADLELLLDSIAAKDLQEIGYLLERYHIPEGGILERVIFRACGVVLEPNEHVVFEKNKNEE